MKELQETWSYVDALEANDWLSLQCDYEWAAHKEAETKSKR